MQPVSSVPPANPGVSMPDHIAPLATLSIHKDEGVIQLDSKRDMRFQSLPRQIRVGKQNRQKPNRREGGTVPDPPTNSLEGVGNHTCNYV